jgi:putative transcriptional regulator
MLRIRLSAILGERKLRIADVARDTGINRGSLTRMYYESAERIELDVLERLCSYLGCTVGDLLEIEPAPGALVFTRRSRPAPDADAAGAQPDRQP